MFRPTTRMGIRCLATVDTVTSSGSQSGASIINVSISSDSDGSFQVFWTDQNSSQYSPYTKRLTEPTGRVKAHQTANCTIYRVHNIQIPSETPTRRVKNCFFSRAARKLSISIICLLLEVGNHRRYYYNGLGGGDVVTLPNISNYNESVGERGPKN